jgi:antitoxin HicB
MKKIYDDRYTGSTFDDFLEEEGMREQVDSAAIKRVLAWQFEQEMLRQQKTKSAMAAELNTSRSQLDRLLDPANTTVSLETLARVARVLGKRLVLELQEHRPARKASVRTRQKSKAASQPQRTLAARRSKAI